MRDTLRDDDEHEGNSTIGSDSCNDEPAYAVEDGIPTGSFVPSPWEIHMSEREPGICFYFSPVTGKKTRTHPGTKNAPMTKLKRKPSSGTPGRVPALDLLRIWDSGASQGMTDRAQVSSKASFTGSRVTIHTGNGIVNSTKYEKMEVAPGTT